MQRILNMQAPFLIRRFVGNPKINWNLSIRARFVADRSCDVRAPETAVACCGSAAYRQRPADPAKPGAGIVCRSGGGRQSKSGPVLRVESPAAAGGFLYSDFN